MSDPNEPPRPDGPSNGPGDAPAPPPSAGYGQPGYGQPDYGQGGYGQPDYGQQYAPPPGYGGPAGEQPGGLGERFLARLIDFILLFVVTLIVDLILAAIFGISGGGLGVGGSYAYAAISGIVSTLIYVGYFAYLESTRGQTLGKMAMKLHVQTVAGGQPTMEQAARRNIWLALPILGIVPLIGGLIGALGELVAVIMIAIGISNDPARRPWTDKFADTRVIKRPS